MTITQSRAVVPRAMTLRVAVRKEKEKMFVKERREQATCSSNSNSAYVSHAQTPKVDTCMQKSDRKERVKKHFTSTCTVSKNKSLQYVI